ELRHTRFHSWRHVTRTRQMRRHRKSANRWLYSGLSGSCGVGAGAVAIVSKFSRFDRLADWLWRIQAQSSRVFCAGLKISKDCADDVTLLYLHKPFTDSARTRRCDVHGGLIRLHFEHILVCSDVITLADEHI